MEKHGFEASKIWRCHGHEMNISWDLYNGFEWLARMAEKP